jgi:hypothetical protein
MHSCRQLDMLQLPEISWVQIGQLKIVIQRCLLVLNGSGLCYIVISSIFFWKCYSTERIRRLVFSVFSIWHVSRTTFLLSFLYILIKDAVHGRPFTPLLSTWWVGPSKQEMKPAMRILSKKIAVYLCPCDPAIPVAFASPTPNPSLPPAVPNGHRPLFEFRIDAYPRA